MLPYHAWIAVRDEDCEPIPLRGEKRRRYYVNVPVNPVYHAPGMVAERYQRRRIWRGLWKVR